MAASPLPPPYSSSPFYTRSSDCTNLNSLLPCVHSAGLLKKTVSSSASSPTVLIREDIADKSSSAHSPALFSKEDDLRHVTHVQNPFPAQNSPSVEPAIALYTRSDSSVQQTFQLRKHKHQFQVAELNHLNVRALANRVHNARSLDEVKLLHAQIKEVGVDQDTYLANLLILLFHRFDDLHSARAVFDALKYPSTVSWNCIIRSYVKFKHLKDALHLFRQMLQKGHRPNRTTFLTVLGACTAPENLAEGKWIHAYVARQNFQRDVAICNALITMYSRCGDLKEATSVFEHMQARSIISWNSVIAAYCKHGQNQKALDHFARMQQERMQPNQRTFVNVIAMFNSPECLADAKEIHNCILDHGFHRELIVGNALIGMYNKCGSPDDALTVFEQMSERDVISWTAMIDAYAENGHSRKAIQLFQEMQVQAIKPNRVTFISVLRACADLGDSDEGKAVHLLLKGEGIPIDIYLGNALIYMYKNCGAIKEARIVFDEMHAHDAVSWTVMLHAYASNKYAKEALDLFSVMQEEKLEPDKSHYISALDACGLLCNLNEGNALHERISKTQFYHDITVKNALICMYSRCGALKTACTIFESMSQRDVVSWNVMITVYANSGHSKEAFDCFAAMQQSGVEPNNLTFFGLLNACTSSSALIEGKAFHRKIIECGFDKELVLGTSLISMYGKCGAIEDALAVFDNMLTPPIASWNAIISAYCHCCNGRGALRILRRMQEINLKPDKVTFLSILGACVILGATDIGKGVHELIKDCGWESDMIVGGALINMYSKFKDLKAAQEVFENMDDQNVVSWTAMIDAYSQHGCHKEAVELLNSMQQQNCQPNRVTLVNALSSCCSPVALEEGRSVHSYTIDVGLEADLIVGNALIGMYGKCQALEYACQAFYRMPNHDVVSWTALMNAFLRCQQYREVLCLLNEMEDEDVQPNQVTFITALRACAALKSIADGKAIHAKMMDAGFVSDILVKQALIDMYHSCDAFEEIYALTSG